MVGGDDQFESVWDGERAYNFERGAFRREATDGAVNRTAAKHNRPSLQYPPRWRNSFFAHRAPPDDRLPMPTCE
jgi:hypothetical protein